MTRIHTAILLALFACHPTGSVSSATGRCGEDERSHEGKCVLDPVRIYSMRPVYPRRAARKKITASVTLGATIDEKGKVEAVKVLSCSSPGHGFEKAAKSAVRKWKYRPGRIDGETAAVPLRIVVDFTPE